MVLWPPQPSMARSGMSSGELSATSRVDGLLDF